MTVDQYEEQVKLKMSEEFRYGWEVCMSENKLPADLPEAGNCKDCYRWSKESQECDLDWINREAKIKDDQFGVFANAWDDSGLVAGLKTGPLFGCVQFRKK